MDLPNSFPVRLTNWQRSEGRNALPWQENRTPYRVWLSEIMLQQTQVATVVPYFERFLRRFPAISDLAAASADEVMSMWTGLGYYSRARNLHACAKAVVDHHDGEFPRTAAAIAELPGIGPSTAAAIASFCFGERVAIFDGNVRRVAARLCAFGEDLSRSKHSRALHDCVQASLSDDLERGHDSASFMAAFTQGLMDLGATVCTPRSPSCSVCPFAIDCKGRDRADELPVVLRKTARKSMHSALLWLTHGDRVWLQQRPAKGVWSGLWTLPVVERESVDTLATRLGWSGRLDVAEPFKHVLTHRDWYLTPVRLALRRGEAAALDDEETLTPGRWFGAKELRDVGLPAPVARLLDSPRPVASDLSSDLSRGTA